jgi:hypothetical protein
VDSWAYLMTNDNPFDGSRTNAEVNAIVPPTEIPRRMIRDEAIPSLTPPAGAVYGLLAANNGYGGWIPTAPLVLIHCPVDDVVPYANSLVVQAAYAGLPPGLVSLVNVPPVPFIDSFLGSLHAAAFPTAMLAAFTAIQTIND